MFLVQCKTLSWRSSPCLDDPPRLKKACEGRRQAARPAPKLGMQGAAWNVVRTLVDLEVVTSVDREYPKRVFPMSPRISCPLA